MADESGARLTWTYSAINIVTWAFTPTSFDVPRVRDAMRHTLRPGLVTGRPAEMASVSDEVVAGGVPVRKYVPKDAKPGALVFFHGGGWVLGDLDSYDILGRALADATHREVFSVSYRLAPESVYPAASNDCVAALRAIVARGGSVAVCGDSAGGNLAAVAAAACAAAGERLVGQVRQLHWRVGAVWMRAYAICAYAGALLSRHGSDDR